MTSEIGPFAETIGRVAYAFSLVQPFLPTYAHLIASALFPIVTAAHASLTRPSSAAKPEKKKKRIGLEEEDEDEEAEDETQQMEGLSPSDAIIFPVFAGMTLAGLYFLIKWLEDPAILNKLLNWYFAIFGVFSVTTLLSDSLGFVQALVFPKRYVARGQLWVVDGKQKRAVALGDTTGHAKSNSPLPGALSRLPLPTAIRRVLWTIREVPRQKWVARLYIHTVVAAKQALGFNGLVSFLTAVACILYFNLVDKPWYLTNLLGFAFSYGALQIMSPTTFGTGTLILSALFFYDIYFVFYTPMMVTVAKSLDVPIKLLIPRPADPEDPTARAHAMLGLGDIVLPGLVIGLALRFDLFMFYLRKQRLVSSDSSGSDGKAQTIAKAKYTSVANRWGERFWTHSWFGQRQLSTQLAASQPELTFPKPYFTAAVTGYTIGMIATLGVMHIFDHAQPALLYLVPGVLFSVWGTALLRGEIKHMWNFSEATEDEEVDKPKDANKDKEIGHELDTKTKYSPKSIFFSEEKLDRIANKQFGLFSEEDADRLDVVDNSKRNQVFSFSIEAPFDLTPMKKEGIASSKEKTTKTKDTTVDAKGTPVTKRARHA